MSRTAAAPKRKRGTSRAAAEYTQTFNVGEVEPTTSGLLAWRALTVPPPTEAEERAMVRVALKRGLRASDLDDLARLGFPLD